MAIYVFLGECVCVCVCVFFYFFPFSNKKIENDIFLKSKIDLFFLIFGRKKNLQFFNTNIEKPRTMWYVLCVCVFCVGGIPSSYLNPAPPNATSLLQLLWHFFPPLDQWGSHHEHTSYNKHYLFIYFSHGTKKSSCCIKTHDGSESKSFFPRKKKGFESEW